MYTVFRANLAAFKSHQMNHWAGSTLLVHTGEAVRGWLNQDLSLDTYIIEGDHYSIIKPPRVTQLGGRITAFIEKIQKRHSQTLSPGRPGGYQI